MTMDKDNNPDLPGQTYIDKVKASIDATVWDRITKDDKVQKALDITAKIGGAHADSFYHATAHLLNCISHAYRKATKSDINPVTTRAIVFCSARDKSIPGDYLRTDRKTSLTAFVDVMATLVSAVQAQAGTRNFESKPWSALVGIGEWNHEDGKDDKLEDTVLDLKRYRPDLPTVHGIVFDSNDELKLVSVNAFGSWFSEPVTVGFESNPYRTAEQETIPATDAWIAYVVLLYRSYARRDKRFSTVDNPVDDSTLWKVELPGFRPIVRPFYAPHRQGRMTWGSFVLDASEHGAPPRAIGFLKTSWQDASARFYETRLLDAAHIGTWLPGLVRHRVASIDQPPLHYRDDPAYHPAMLKELVCLSSIGHPLSQCRSALHLLKVMYDATETNLQLLQADVMHGDVSWFNILCNPWHDDAATLAIKPVLPGIPCIDAILTGDTANSQPCALILDLDHGATLTDLFTDESLRGYAKIATPMFISVELSSKNPIPCGSAYSLATIVDRLAALDSRPELFERAFPEGDDDFMDNLRNVVKMEKERAAKFEDADTNPASRHRPHHEVESLYWVLLWAFARACPLGHSPDGEQDDHFSCFADTMLAHTLNVESRRSLYLSGIGPQRSIFHPLLQNEFCRALRDLAIYLAVPWHLYCPHVHPNHAHVAMRRILLPLIDDIVKGKIKDVLFDTTQPRTIQTSRYGGYRKPSPDLWSATTTKPLDRGGSSSTSCPTASASPASSPQRPSSLEPASSDPAADQAPVVGNGEQSHAIHGVKRVRDDEEDEPGPKRVKTEAPKTHPRDVDALIKMFWADRELWFGSGFGKEADAKAWQSEVYKQCTFSS